MELHEGLPQHGASRQAHYKRFACQRAYSARNKVAVDLANEERRHQPRIGTRKLQHLLDPPLEQAAILIGHDAPPDGLREACMLAQPLHAYHKTTHNHHHY